MAAETHKRRALLDELERLAKAAEPVPWIEVTLLGRTEADDALVLAAVNALPDLIAAARETERLQQRAAELERGIETLRDNWPKTVPASMDTPR